MYKHGKTFFPLFFHSLWNEQHNICFKTNSQVFAVFAVEVNFSHTIFIRTHL